MKSALFVTQQYNAIRSPIRDDRSLIRDDRSLIREYFSFVRRQKSAVINDPSSLGVVRRDNQRQSEKSVTSSPEGGDSDVIIIIPFTRNNSSDRSTKGVMRFGRARVKTDNVAVVKDASGVR